MKKDYVNLVNKLIMEFKLNPTSKLGVEVHTKLRKVVNVLFNGKLQAGENILVQREKGAELKEIKNELADVAKYFLVGKKDQKQKDKEERKKEFSKNLQNITTDKHKDSLTQALNKDLNEESGGAVVMDDVGLTRKGFKFITGGQVEADNKDISPQEFELHTKELKEKLKDKNHPLSKRKDWIEVLYTDAKGDLVTRALTNKERKELNANSSGDVI